jgi:hypothetical protein
MKVLIYDNYKATHQNPKISDRSNFQMMLDIFNELPDTHGVELNFIVGTNKPAELEQVECDLLCVNYYVPFMRTLKFNILICSRMDSCGLNSRNLKQLDAPNVSLVGKEYVFTDRQNYTRRFVEGRLHSELIWQSYKTDYSKVWQHRQSYRDRLKCHLSRIVPFSWKPFDAKIEENKVVDVFFVCHIHEKSPSLSRHRREGLEKCKQICEKHGFTALVGSLPRKEYFPSLRKSKVCIAPYGWGSRIALDQYGLATGTLIVKANMQHVLTVPNIYTAEYMYIVDPNWDMLEEVLCNLLHNYTSKYKQIALQRKNKVKNFNKEYYQQHIVDIFRMAHTKQKQL